MNKLWGFMLIISFTFSILFGDIENAVSVFFDSTKQSIDLCINILGIVCLWTGIIKIAEKSGLLEKMATIVSPILNFLFPKLKKEKSAKSHIALNMAANILGLGNVATPMGIKAMEELQKINKNKDVISDEMMMLIVLNTTSIQLIPTTVIAVRSSYDSENPVAIILPIIIASFVSAFLGVVIVKIYNKIKRGNP